MISRICGSTVRRIGVKVGCALLVVTMVAPVVAQNFPGLPAGQTAGENVVPTADRRPGAMVNAGVFRAQNTVRNPFAVPNITATEPTLTPLQMFGVEAADIVAAGMADFLVFLAERFLGRAGVKLDAASLILVGFLGETGLSLSDLIGLNGKTIQRQGEDISPQAATAQKLPPSRTSYR